MKTDYNFTEDVSIKIDSCGTLFINNSNGNCIYSKNPNGYKQWNDYDKNNNLIHYKDSNGFEWWFEYDLDNNEIHLKNSDGFESWREYDEHHTLIHYRNSDRCEGWWYNGNGDEITKEQFDSIHNPCNGKTVTIDGKEYTLTHV